MPVTGVRRYINPSLPVGSTNPPPIQNPVLRPGSTVTPGTPIRPPAPYSPAKPIGNKPGKK